MRHVTFTYDEGGRITVVENRKSDDSEVNIFTYTYDCAGNRIGVEETNGDVTTWTYDGTYQLIREQRSGANSYDVTYTYDNTGNRVTQEDDGELTTYTYDEANQLLTSEDASGITTYTYDDDGNRIEKETPTETTYYTWDEQNRLTEAEPPAGTVTLTYNPDGQRVQRESVAETKKFIYDFKNVLQETDDADATQQTYTSTTAEYGHLISEYDGSGTAFHQYDALGTTDALLDEAEAATDRYAHRAFGLQQSHTGTSDSPYTFVGQQHYYRDEQLELYLLGMGNSDHGGRHYDPTTGAFLSKDPSGYEDDENLYRYVGNNPVSASDPSGHQKPLDYAAPVVWQWRDGELSDQEFLDAYFAWVKAEDPAAGVAYRMLLVREREALQRVIRTRTAPARRKASPEEHAKRLAEKYDRRPVATVRPQLDEDAPEFPEAPPAWVQEGPGPSDVGEDAPEAAAADSTPSIEERIEQTRAIVQDARERIERRRSHNATVVALLQRSWDSYYSESLQRNRKRLGKLLKKVDQSDVGSREFNAAIKERREIYEASAAYANRMFAGNRELVKSRTAEHRAEEAQIIREAEEAIEEQLSGLSRDADLNRKLMELQIRRITEGEDFAATVLLGREVSARAQSNMKVLIGVYSETVQVVLGAAKPVSAFAGFFGKRGGTKAGQEAAKGGRLKKLKDAAASAWKKLKSKIPKRSRKTTTLADDTARAVSSVPKGKLTRIGDFDHLRHYQFEGATGGKWDFLLDAEVVNGRLIVKEGHITPVRGTFKDAQNILGKDGLEDLARTLGHEFNVNQIDIPSKIGRIPVDGQKHVPFGQVRIVIDDAGQISISRLPASE